MSDKEIEINGKSYGENTKVTLSVKTIAWIVGVLIVVAGTLSGIGYYDIKANQREMQKKYDDGIELIKKEMIKAVKDELKEFREKDTKFIEDIGEMKGDIKVILDRTKRNNDHNNTGAIIPVETVVPTTIPTR